MSKFSEDDLKVFDYSAQFEFREPEPTLNTDLGMFVVIDNLPKAPKDKLPKLEVLINKLLSLKDKVQVIRLELTANESGDGAGYGFAEFKDEKTALEVVAALDNFEIDKKMKLNLKLNIVSDFEKHLKSSSAEFVPKQFKEPSFQGSWLLDKQARDQFAIRYYDTTEILWNESAQKPISAFRKENWSDNIEWSPLGTLVATFHDKGIVVWGGEKFEKQAAFAHPHAKKIDFSPKEKYIVTWNEDKEKNVVFWNVRTGKSQEVLTVPIPKQHIHELWPIFKCSFG
jgi:translation initiation factor 3 subunit B